MHWNKIDFIAGVRSARSRPGVSPRIKVILCAKIRESCVVGVVEGHARKLAGAAIGESDPDADAGGVVPVHPDEAFCVLLESNQGNLLSLWDQAPVWRRFRCADTSGDFQSSSTEGHWPATHVCRPRRDRIIPRIRLTRWPGTARCFPGQEPKAAAPTPGTGWGLPVADALAGRAERSPEWTAGC